MASNLRNVLIRAYTFDMRQNAGNVVVAEINFRRVEMIAPYTPSSPPMAVNLPGAVLIDSAASLGPLADLTRRNVGYLVFIRSTDELLWLPIRAELSAGDYWTIECVPWVEYLRTCSLPDEEIVRRAHQL